MMDDGWARSTYQGRLALLGEPQLVRRRGVEDAILQVLSSHLTPLESKQPSIRRGSFVYHCPLSTSVKSPKTERA